MLSRASCQLMAIDCSDVPANVSYSCDNPWGSGCVSRTGFHLDILWKYTQHIQAACPTDQRLHLPDGGRASPQNASLTQAACEAFAGKGWTYYSTAEIWNRMTMWVCRFALPLPHLPMSIALRHRMGERPLRIGCLWPCLLSNIYKIARMLTA